MSSPRKSTAFTEKRGRLIRQARMDAKLSQEAMASILGLESRNLLSSYENGTVGVLKPAVIKALVERFGLELSDLTEDEALLGTGPDLPEMSGQARRVARVWDKLPAPMREALWAQIQAVAQLEAISPALFAVISSTGVPDPEPAKRPAASARPERRHAPK